MIWVELPPMKHRRRAPDVHVLDADRVVVAGGGPPEVFSFAANAWAPYAGAVPRRARPTPGLVIGGTSTSGGGPFEEHTHSTHTCTLDGKPAGELVCARHDAGAAVLANGAIFVAGGSHDEDAEPLAHVEIGLPPGVAYDCVRPQLDARELKATLAYVKDADFADAERVARDACRRWPDEADLWRARGKAESGLGKGAEAVASLQRAVTLEEDSPFHHCALGDALLAIERRDEALAAFERAISLAEEDPMWCGPLLTHARSQRQFIRVDPDDVGGGTSADWNNRGVALERQGRNAEALGCFDKALKLDRDNSYAHGNRAKVLLALKRPKEAARAARRAIALCATDRDRCSSAWLLLGMALFDLKDYARSLDAYDRGIALDVTPNHWNNRGNTLLKLKRYEDALESFEKASAGGHSGAPWGEAATLCFLGRVDEARPRADEAVRRDPSQEAAMEADPDLTPLYARCADGRAAGRGRRARRG